LTGFTIGTKLTVAEGLFTGLKTVIGTVVVVVVTVVMIVCCWTGDTEGEGEIKDGGETKVGPTVCNPLIEDWLAVLESLQLIWLKKLYGCPLFRTQTPSFSVEIELHTHFPLIKTWFNFSGQSLHA
jgi:hypothetical protein